MSALCKRQNASAQKHVFKETITQKANCCSLKVILLQRLNSFFFRPSKIEIEECKLSLFLPFFLCFLVPFSGEMRRSELRGLRERNFSKAVNFDDIQSPCRDKDAEEMEALNRSGPAKTSHRSNGNFFESREKLDSF